MEIVKNKRDNLLKKRNVKCKNCKSILRVTYIDLHRVWDEENCLTGYYVVCKCCGKAVDIPLKKARKIL